MNIFKKMIKILFILTMAFILLAGIFSIFLRTRPAEKMPIIGGYKPLNVLGGSMEPAIKLGSIILVKEISGSGIKVGDIITFRPKTKLNSVKENQTMVTHRVVKLFTKKGERSFETKGDANKTSDGNRVKESQVIGKVVSSIPYLGELSLFTKSRNGFLMLIVLPGLAIIITELISIFKNVKVLRRHGNG